MKNFNLPLVCFCLLFLLSQLAHGQRNFVEGKILFQSGDSLMGYINYKNWRRNPEKISFKENAEQKETNFYPSDIKGFQVKEEEYVSATVEIETSPSHTLKLTEDSIFHFEEATVFLQVLVRGIKSLHYLNDINDKEHFYIYRKDKFELLRHKKYIRYVKEKDPFEDFWVKEHLVMETQKHTFQLMEYLDHCADIYQKLYNLSYSRKSLESLFYYYYQCRGYEPTYQMHSEKVISRPGLIAGVSSTAFSFTSNFFTALDAIEFPRSNNISAGGFVEFVLPRSRRRWSFYNELLYMRYHMEATYQEVKSADNFSEVSLAFGQAYLKLNTMLRYTQPIKEVSIFFQAGLSNGFLVGETNYKKTESWIFSNFSEKEENLISETQPHETEILIGLGTRFKKISLDMRYEQGNGPSTNLALKGNVERFYLLLGYRF